jgi:hypothetical protein
MVDIFIHDNGLIHMITRRKIQITEKKEIDTLLQKKSENMGVLRFV